MRHDRPNDARATATDASAADGAGTETDADTGRIGETRSEPPLDRFPSPRAQTRRDRLAGALRANLLRRKAKARAGKGEAGGDRPALKHR